MNYADGTYIKFGDILTKLDVPIGYWVAIEKIATPADVKDGAFVGIWTNPASGITYYDNTVWVESLAMAKFLGERHDQLAIWDCANETEVWLSKAEPIVEMMEPSA